MESAHFQETKGWPSLALTVKTVDEFLVSNGEVRQRVALHDVQAWGKLAQLRKGIQRYETITVEGRMQPSTDGTRLIASTIEPLPAVAPAASRAAAVSREITSDDIESDDDMPF